MLLAHWIRSIRFAAVFAALGLASTHALGDSPPELLDHGTFVNLVRLPDGNLIRLQTRFGFVRTQLSTDNGTTWGPIINEFPATGTTNPIPLLAQDSELHLFRFVLRDERNGDPTQPGVNFFLDLWHHQTLNEMTQWIEHPRIFDGYIGSIMNATQSRSGRLIVPFGTRDSSATSSSPSGLNYTTAAYSDDNGSTWQISPSRLTSPVPSDWNGARDGAVEPTIVQLNDDRLWMLMRSQTGRLTESFSTDDGTTWSAPKNSTFHTTTGPPNIIRMDDGRLVLFWNNGTMPPRYNGGIWYAGRDALHAAISDDDGLTWKGFRELYLDPFRNQDPAAGDSGTAYPFPALTNDGQIIMMTGQAQARTMLRFDPNWLLATDRTDDFTAPNALDNWTVYKSHGEIVNVKRGRVQGPELVHDAGLGKPVLHVRRPDEKDPDGAVWNFPMARKGETTIRLKLQEGFAGGAIALADRFFEPTDTQGEELSIFHLPIAADGSLPGGYVLEKGVWYDLDVKWDLATHRATVKTRGQTVAELVQRHQALPGPSYLRLRSTAPTVDTAGFLVDRVANIGESTGPVRESIRMSAAESHDLLESASGWTTIRIDDYVPNNNILPLGNTGEFASPFTGFISPTTDAPPVGILVESSTGTVTFTDETLLRHTSDLLGSKNGETLTFTFVDPNDPTQPATVSQVAWRFGSTVADNVEVTLLDIRGVEMPDYLFAALDTTSSGSSIGFHALQDLHPESAIHQIVFSGMGDDTWLIGSFEQSTALADFGFSGFTVVRVPPGNANAVVPEPSGLAIFTLGIVLWRRCTSRSGLKRG